MGSPPTKERLSEDWGYRFRDCWNLINLRPMTEETARVAICRCGWLWVQRARSAVPSPSLGQRHGTTYRAQGTLTSLQRATHAIHPHKHQGLCWATVSVLAPPAVACVMRSCCPQLSDLISLSSSPHTFSALVIRSCQPMHASMLFLSFANCRNLLNSILLRFQCIMLHDAILQSHLWPAPFIILFHSLGRDA